MRRSTKNPAAGSDRAPKTFCLVAERLEDSRNALHLQIHFVACRVGSIDPATLAALASVALGEVRA